MFYVVSLLFILAIMLIINYILNDEIYIAPSVIFTGVFAFSTFWLIFFMEKWNIDLHLNTICVIFLGTLIFSITCILSSEWYKKKYGRQYQDEQELFFYDIDKNKINLYLVFCIVINILTIYFTIKAVNGSIFNIGAALYKYRNLTAYKGQSLNMPAIIDILSGIMHASSYWFLYVFINNFINTKKIDLKILFIIILCIISTVLDGSRGALVNNILAIIPLFFLLKNKNSGYKNKMKLKSIILILIFGSILLSTLQWTAVLLGRNDIKDMDTLDYVAMYAGAEIKNLDTYLQEKHETETYIGIHTFSSLYEILNKLIATNGMNANIQAVYRSVNNYNLGNVYTIFFDFICDLGYWGVVIFTTIMATFTQMIFEKCKREKFSQSGPSIIILTYCYIFGGIVFVFFGNKFFPQTFSLGFIKYLILWKLCNWFFCKLKIIYK